MSYIKPDFLLQSDTAIELYEKYAKNEPIFDYHCHLSEYQIYENKPFNNLFEIWLSGDHYKWRLMRNYGVGEEYITGNKTPKEKFIAYCKTLEKAFGNPLYHWSQIELKEFFDCELEINEKNANQIWDECNEYIIRNNVTPQKLIEQSKVKCLFTTNEIFDDLKIFDLIKTKNYKFEVRPAFRADKIMNIEADKYNEFVAKLGKIEKFDDLLTAIEERLNAFIKAGCVASDTALQMVYEMPAKEDAANIFDRRIKGKAVSLKESEIFKGYLTYYLLKLYAKYNIRSELHIGAMRNNNTKMLNKLGLDSGFDSIAEDNSVKNLSRLMDRLNNEDSLPPMIIFNLNPKMNAEIMTLIGCFQDSSMKGKIQYGAAWWFLDNKAGIEKHLQDMTATGHIDSFIGMLTDSRSFLSYPRHQYFRRLLCNYLANMMDNGEMTNNKEIVGDVIKNICYNNAKEYFLG